MFRVVTGLGVALLFLAVLLSGEKAEARQAPCWAGGSAFLRFDCTYSGYYCGSYATYVYQRFGRNGKITDFNLFWPGGKVRQNISKDTLEVIVNYPEERLIIRILFHFKCNANECIALVQHGSIEAAYENVGVITSCGITTPADYCYCDYGEGIEARDEEQKKDAKSLVDFVNDLVAEKLSNP